MRFNSSMGVLLVMALTLCQSASATAPGGAQDKGGSPQDNKDKKADDKGSGTPIVNIPKSNSSLQTPEMAADGFTPSDPSTWDASKKQRICDAIAKDWQATYKSAVYYQPSFDACMSGKYAAGQLASNQSLEMKMVCFTPTKPLTNWGAAKTNEICDMYVNGPAFNGMHPNFKAHWKKACRTNQQVIVEKYIPATVNFQGVPKDYIANPPTGQGYAYLEFGYWKKTKQDGLFGDSCNAGDNPLNQNPDGKGRTAPIPVAK